MRSGSSAQRRSWSIETFHFIQEFTLIVIPEDRFEEWLSTPSPKGSEDPRFEVKAASPSDFERIFDCVNEAFGTRRPSALYDWLYRRNPYGLARIWYIEEVSTKRVIKSSSDFPWPMFLDETPRSGFFGGDSVTVPDWQRKGLSELFYQVRDNHPWYRDRIQMGAPNAASIAVGKKRGADNELLGMIPGGVAFLRSGAPSEFTSLPSSVAKVLGAVASGLSEGWRALTLPLPAETRFEPLDQFTSDIDPLTWEATRFDRYWCPHNAQWLNWRYLNHPIEPYAAFILLDRQSDRPLGYSVLRLSGTKATLSEFAASDEHAPALLRHTLAAAKSAGCSYMNTFKMPGWRHWGLLRRSGFFPYQTHNHFFGTDYQDPKRFLGLECWQLTPGDRDFH